MNVCEKIIHFLSEVVERMKHFDTARDMAEGLGLTPELFSGALRVTVWGRRQVMVEQHRGLLGYSALFLATATAIRGYKAGKVHG